MSRRAKGEGTIFYEASRKRWVGQLPAEPGPGGTRRRGPKVFGKTRKEVAGKLADQRRRRSVDRNSQTLGQYLRWFIEVHDADLLRRGDLAPQTVDSHRQSLIGHVAELSGHVKLTAFRPADTNRLLGWLSDRGLAASTQRLILTHLRAALDVAVSNEWLDRNPTRATSVRVPKVAATRRDVLTDPADADRLIGALDRHAALHLTMLLTGMRIAEALGLVWDDVDLGKGEINLSRQIIRRDGEWHREPLKKRGPDDARIIPMVDALADKLAAHRKEQARQRIAAPTWFTRWNLVFTRELGEPIGPWMARDSLSEAVTRAWPTGAPHLTPHSLRRSAATALVANRVPIPDIMAILGHKSASMLLEVYAQSTGRSYDDAKRALASQIQ